MIGQAEIMSRNQALVVAAVAVSPTSPLLPLVLPRQSISPALLTRYHWVLQLLMRVGIYCEVLEVKCNLPKKWGVIIPEK